MKNIIVDSGGINWNWYAEYELGETVNGLTKAKKLWSDRFHKFNERQGASQHPTATHNFSSGTTKPVLRVYAREMTDEEKKQEQDSFDFFWKGWVNWCKQFKVDPNGEVTSIQVVHDRATGEKLVLTN